jgi:cytochrome c biogenesis protein ResB
MRRLWRSLASVKTTVVIFIMVAILLLLNVVIPKARFSGPEADGLIDRNPINHFLLDTLGMAEMPTSPVFFAVLALFFVNLSCVLIDRSGVTFRRTKLRPPSRDTLEAWASGKRSLRGSPNQTLDGHQVVAVLKGVGYRALQVADGVVWSVKHRHAPLGFVVFHISFYLLCLGGIGLYYTRFVGTSALVEGQDFAGFNQVLREAPILGRPSLRFGVKEVNPVFDHGQALHLEAVMRFDGGVEKSARINHPIRLGATKILVNRAGIAPVLWLQDRRGFTVDRVAVAAATLASEPTEAELAGGALKVLVRPVVDRARFPGRAELQATEVRTVVTDAEGTMLFEGVLRSGQSAQLDGGVLVLQELRFWVGVYVVREYGAWLLVAGFVVGTVGLVWRLMLYRREVAVVWDQESFAVAGRAEYFSHKFKDELETIKDFLERGGTV